MWDDVKQTKSIPRDYLETIYVSISEQPIRTETSSDPLALVTLEEWTNISMTVQRYQETMLLFTTHYPTVQLLPSFTTTDTTDTTDTTNTTSTNATGLVSYAKVGSSRIWKERTGRLLDLSIDFLWEYLSLLSSYELTQ